MEELTENIEDIIRDAYKIALSNEDIERVCEGRINVISYEDLDNFTDSLEDLFYPYGVVIILIQWRQNFGHWITLIDHNYTGNGNYLEQFDPFGSFFDAQFEKSNPYGLTKQLTRLFLNSDYDYTQFNIHRFQDIKNNTCGRWAIVRALCKDRNLDEFTDLFDNQELALEPDFYITAITLFSS